MTTTADIQVAERPILFSGEMVRAILDGRKSQTRRVIKPQPNNPAGPNYDGLWSDTIDPVTRYFACPYGMPGTMLWVRETWAATTNLGEYEDWPGCPHLHHEEIAERFPGFEARFGFDAIIYRATPGKNWVWLDENGGMTERSFWKPSIHMPRWASRITLELLKVRVERVQEIAIEDIKAEGTQVSGTKADQPWVTNQEEYDRVLPFAFRELWDRINAKRGFGWDANPWVWVLEFRRVKE